MHNYDFIKINDISPGDLVSLERAGDVIPKITGVVEKIGTPYKPPTTCPSCDEPLSRNNVTLVCLNEECPERIKQMINYWIKVVDIKGLGDKNIDKLISSGILKTVGDLYGPKMSEHTLIAKLGKNGKKIYQEIQNKKTLPLDLLLAGLGIEGVGKITAKVLTKHFPTLEDLVKANKSDLLKVEGISDISAEKIISGIQANQVLQDLLNNGVKIGKLKIVKKEKPAVKLTDFLGSSYKESEKITSSNSKDNKKEIQTVEQEPVITESKGKVYVTGSVSGMTKDQIQEFVERKGYEWSTSVSGKLTLLIMGNKPGIAKIDKATKLGVKIMSWEKFLRENTV